MLKATLHRLLRRIRRFLRDGRRDSAASLNQPLDMQGFFCEAPFSQLDVYEGGRLHSCCSSWLPTPLGKLGTDSLREVWNSETSQKIRKSILDGSFRYCDAKICPRIQAKSLPTVADMRRVPRYRTIIDQRRTVLDELPSFINLCNDSSCNLYCPSCRTSRVLHNKGQALAERRRIQDIIATELFARPSARQFDVNITGSGDPFASTVFRDFLFNLDGSKFPNLRVHLQTNGVLLTPSNWAKLHRIHANIAVILISFDAATEATYRITRPGGHWDTLLANVARLGRQRQAGELKLLRLDFVVQNANFREMPAFVALAKRLGADRAAFSMVLDWGTWSPADYQRQCIWKKSHADFARFMDVLRDPVFDDPIVDLGNLTGYRKIARNLIASSATG